MNRELASQPGGQETSNVAHSARVKRVRLRPVERDDEPGVEKRGRRQEGEVVRHRPAKRKLRWRRIPNLKSVGVEKTGAE